MSASLKNTTPFDPRSISGCQLWLDAFDRTTMTFSSGSNLSTWRNKGGAGGVFTQAGTASRLVYTSSNSYPLINFDSDGSSLNAWMTGTLTFPASCSFIQVITPIAYSVGTWNFHWSWQWGSIGNRLPGFRSLNSSRAFEPYITWVGNNNNSIPVTNGVSYLSFVEFTSGGANTRYSINGNTPASGTIAASNVNSSTFLLGGDGNNGATVWGKMYLSEIIMFSNVLTTSQREQVEGYLAWKWGLSASLPPRHPFRGGPVPFPFTLERSRMRVTQVFDPRSISGCLLWLDANDPNGNGSLVSSGTVLTRWVDKSGTGNTLRANGSPILSNYSNRNAVYINSNHLSNSSSLTNANTTIFFVLCISTPINDKSYFQMGANPNNGGGDTTTFFSDVNVTRPGGNGSGRLYYGDGGGNQMSLSFPTATAADVVPFCIQTARLRSQPVVQNFINGTLRNSKTGVVTRVNHNGIIVGSSNGGWQWTGFFSEILMYNSALSDTNMQRIEGYLARKWNLTLASTHPNANLLTIAPFPLQNISRSLRPSLFSPLNIPGCQLWLDAADSSAFSLVGSNVFQWNDKSGNGYHAIPRSTARTPVRYKGFNDLFTVESSVVSEFGNTLLSTLPSSNVQGSTGYSFFYVGRFFSGTVFVQYEWDNLRMISIEGTTRFDYGQPNSVYSFPPGYTNSSNHMINMDVNKSSSKLAFRYNGLFLSNYSVTPPTTTFTTSMGIFGRGGSSSNVPAFGQISELLIYNKTLDSTQQQQIEGYLAWKWRLKTSLPSTHPYAKFPPTA